MPALAAALFDAGTLERAWEVAATASELGIRSGLARVRWRSAVELERLRVFRHPDKTDPDASLAVCRRAIAALTGLDDDLGLARAHFLACELVWLQGRSEAGYQHAERVLHHARRAGSGFEIDTGISCMAWALVVNEIPGLRGDPPLRSPRAGGGRTLRRTQPAWVPRGARAMAGRFALARTELAAARASLTDLGLQQASVWMAVYDAMAEMLAGDGVAAERALADAELIAHAIGDRWFLSTILVDRAHAALAQGGTAVAADAVARVEEVQAPNDLEWRIKRHAARAKLAAMTGDAGSALMEARTAVMLADATEMFTFRADAYRDLAEVAAQVGQADDARAATATAHALYKAKENVAAIGQLSARAAAGFAPPTSASASRDPSAVDAP